MSKRLIKIQKGKIKGSIPLDGYMKVAYSDVREFSFLLFRNPPKDDLRDYVIKAR